MFSKFVTQKMCQKGQFEDDMQGTSKCLTRACAFASSLDIVHDVPHIMYDWLEGSTKNEYVHVPLLITMHV